MEAEQRIHSSALAITLILSLACALTVLQLFAGRGAHVTDPTSRTHDLKCAFS